jgi:tetratricopeptide (TPR) repeat protein
VAVVLPVVLLLIDYYKGRKITINVLLEKSPFLMISFGAGILSFLLKNQTGSVGDLAVFTFSFRPVFASYGFITYLFKLLFPLNLSAFYPYPMNHGEIYVPLRYYAYLFAIIGLAAYILSSHRQSKKVLFGAGFFIINIFLVLQLLPVGNTIMADRYSYIPSIGIFYLAGEGIIFLWSKNLRWPAIALISGAAILFSIKTYARCGVWKDDMTLWNDVISRDKNVAEAYFNRGILFMNYNKNSEAMSDFNRAIEIKPGFANFYNGRGVIFTREKRINEAINDFSIAIALDPNNAEAYNNRGFVFMRIGRNSEALRDFNKAIELNPGYAQALYNRGNVFANEGKPDEAAKEFNKAKELKPR